MDKTSQAPTEIIKVPDGTVFNLSVSIETYNLLNTAISYLPYKDAVIIYNDLQNQIKEQIK